MLVLVILSFYALSASCLNASINSTSDIKSIQQQIQSVLAEIIPKVNSYMVKPEAGSGGSVTKRDDYHLIRPNDNKIGTLPDEIKNATSMEILKSLVRIDEKHVQFVRLEEVESKKNVSYLALETNSFVESVNLAYSHHLPLVITPDIVWYLVASGISTHINKNAEQLRHKFVEHEGKKTIQVRRDDFVFNSSSNPWHEVIDEFAVKVANHTLANVSELFEANFTTTSAESSIVSRIVLLESMQKYFSLEFVTLCGIPEIRVKGSKQDWIGIKIKFERVLQQIPELGKWADSLFEVLEHFINLFDGNVNQKFWNEIYKVKGGSGGPYLSGWILSLFPYLKDDETNYYIWEKTWRDAYNASFFGGLTTSQFPVGLSRVPFKWLYLSKEIDMAFLGGLMSVRHNLNDQSLQSTFGYAIDYKKFIENDASKKKKSEAEMDLDVF